MTMTSPRRPSSTARVALALGALSAALLLGPIAVHAAGTGTGTEVAATAAAHGAGHFHGCTAPDFPVPGQDPHCPPGA
ncbi:hypothetical protein [Clavibacter capsici]|uniref:hypothetical protein n=1 Tax=Clavibacter capsici TaxID=1874630 RepID=UPI0014281277|nr:hypothetical protein [Clavibacter capsici]QIS38122.1 hypothetical protein GW572_01245 [Clavibacter capsici]